MGRSEGGVCPGCAPGQPLGALVGEVDHDGGVVASPGMYLMGMPFLRRRKSGLIDGAGDDARDLTAHLAAYLAGAHPA